MNVALLPRMALRTGAKKRIAMQLCSGEISLAPSQKSKNAFKNNPLNRPIEKLFFHRVLAEKKTEKSPMDKLQLGVLLNCGPEKIAVAPPPIYPVEPYQRKPHEDL